MSSLFGCSACDSQPSGQVRSDCRDCAIRELARGPLFFESMRAQKLTDAYKAACRTLGSVKDVHAEVRAAAKQHATGARG